VTVYRVAASLDAVPLDDDAVLLRGDMASCRLEGEAATVFAERILPHLRSWASVEAIMPSLEGYAAADVTNLIESLIPSGLVLRRSGVPSGRPGTAARALADLGIDEGGAGDHLAKLRVGVFGLGPVGWAVGEALLDSGIGRVVVADPEMHERLLESHPGDRDRCDVLDGIFSRETVEQAAFDLDLMIVTVDRGFLAARHWVNRASLASGCPALFVDVALHEAIIGPTVLPGETGCYMCLRMRHIATSDNFKEVMAHERHLDAAKDATAARPLMPGLAQTAAGIATGEAFRLLFGPLIPAFTNAVLVVDATEATFERHTVLRQPDCPHCKGIDTAVRAGG
jgi:ribosomal protein S12 methylthiotransferase accessory factor